jgi:anaerobic selenocysteine-containing dehydrogenase
MSTTKAARGVTSASNQTGIVRLLAILVMIGGAVLALGGGATWGVVQTSLAAEKVTVAEDAANFAGEPVDGPLTAYAQADIIKHHALEASGGKTYAELDREDPARATVMNGSFLRASLFTSVVSFGIAAMAMGLGVLFLLVGFALLKITPKTARVE